MYQQNIVKDGVQTSKLVLSENSKPLKQAWNANLTFLRHPVLPVLLAWREEKTDMSFLSIN